MKADNGDKGVLVDTKMVMAIGSLAFKPGQTAAVEEYTWGDMPWVADEMVRRWKALCEPARGFETPPPYFATGEVVGKVSLATCFTKIEQRFAAHHKHRWHQTY